MQGRAWPAYRRSGGAVHSRPQWAGGPGGAHLLPGAACPPHPRPTVRASALPWHLLPAWRVPSPWRQQPASQHLPWPGMHAADGYTTDRAQLLFLHADQQARNAVLQCSE